MSVLVGTGGGRQPKARLGFATELSLCLLIRDWAHISDHTTRDLKAHEPPPVPSSSQIADLDRTESHAAWQLWWTQTGNATIREGSPDEFADHPLVREFTRVARLPEARSWVWAQKRRVTSGFRAHHHRALPAGFGRRIDVPMSIYVPAAEGISLIPLADHHVLVSPDLLADHDEYSRRLIAHISSLD